MITINVDEAIKKIQREFSQLSDTEVRKCIVRAINRSIQFGKTASSKEIRQKYNIDSSTVNSKVQSQNAKASSLIGYINASAVPISLARFQPQFSFTENTQFSLSRNLDGKTKTLKRKSKLFRKGVSVEIIKGNRKTIPFAFMLAGKKPVFARGEYKSGGAYGFMKRTQRINKSGNDSPITPLITTTVHTALTSDRVMPVIYEGVNQKFMDRMVHELEYQISKIRP